MCSTSYYFTCVHMRQTAPSVYVCIVLVETMSLPLFLYLNGVEVAHGQVLSSKGKHDRHMQACTDSKYESSCELNICWFVYMRAV